MPELPEVQTVVIELRKRLIGKKCLGIKVNLPKLIKNVAPAKMIETLTGAKFIQIERIGKYIVFHFDNAWSLISHLRLEGKYFFDAPSVPLDSLRAHLVFDLGDFQLRYYDSRQFGTFHLYPTDAVATSQEIKKVGIDPLNPSFDWQTCKNLLGKSNRNIKVALLDQTLISGLGNIYVNEVLFACKISPLRRTKDLSDRDFQNIVLNTRTILEESIKNKGTTIFSFQFARGQSGNFQKKLRVHLRLGMPCYRCNTIIKKIKVNGRGTYYCPMCQSR